MNLRDKILFEPPEIGCVLSLTGLPGGGSKIYDRSPYGNIGTIVGATWTRLPSGLWCLYFDGSDDGVDCGTPSAITNVSVELWIKRAATGIAVAMSRWADGGNQRAYALYWWSDNKLNFALSTTGANFPAATSSSAYTDTNWHHLVGTYDGVKINLYLDNVLIGTKAQTGNLYAATASIEIGKCSDFGGVARYLTGRIALPRIYNKALSALEIQNHFYREKHLFGVW